MQGQLLLCRQHQFHLHQLCVFHPDTGFTALQSPWAVTVQRANLTLVFPGKEKVTVRSVPLAVLLLRVMPFSLLSLRAASAGGAAERKMRR